MPITGTPTPPILVDPQDLGITFIGHSSFLIQIANRNLLIDPVFATRLILLRRARRPGLRIQDLPPIDAVLLTHAHMDHLNLPSLRKIIRHTRRVTGVSPRAIVPKGVGDLVAKLGFRAITELDWWQATTLLADTPGEDITITMTPSKHWGARMFSDTHRHYGGYVIASGDHNVSGAYGAGEVHSANRDKSARTSQNDHATRIQSTAQSDRPGRSDSTAKSEPATRSESTTNGEHPAYSVYHSGDTAYFPGFHEIGTRLKPQVALLPIGAYYPDSYRAVHTSPEDALQAFLDLGTATTMIPMHFGTFPLGREPMDEPPIRLRAAAKKAGIANRIRILNEGEMFSETAQRSLIPARAQSRSS